MLYGPHYEANNSTVRGELRLTCGELQHALDAADCLNGDPQINLSVPIRRLVIDGTPIRDGTPTERLSIVGDCPEKPLELSLRGNISSN